MADYFFRTVPVVGTMWSRTGGVVANPHNAYRLLREQGQLALVFPEGSKGPSKTFAERYQLRRFGRGGFVEIAMRAGVPIVPIAVVGSEEAMPILFRIPALGRLLRLPYFPVTANMVAMGPLGILVPVPVQAQAARVGSGHLRRPTRPRALLALQGHGGGREDPGRSATNRLRPALGAPQCLVRLTTTSGASSSPAPTPSGAAGWPRRSRPTRRSTSSSRLGSADPAVALDRTDFVKVSDHAYSTLNRIVSATGVDTIVHTGLIVDSTLGSSNRLQDTNVIGTLNLLAAAGAPGSTVKSLVVKSSGLVYGATSRTPTRSASR